MFEKRKLRGGRGRRLGTNKSLHEVSCPLYTLKANHTLRDV
jgi:hypothetical protein